MTKQEVNKISKMPVEVEDLKKFFEEYLENPKKEKYGLSWAGKVNAKKEALIPTSKTLSPQEDESKDWDDTENVFIEGDNLDALKLLQRKYFEKIKMIYIDPPYNTGKDFIYRDNFSRSSKEELEESGEMVDGKLLTTNAKTNGRFHSDWLNMMYSRLFLAHKLLKDDGVIFISIDDNEVANLRLLMDEIFGEENFVAQIAYQNMDTVKNDAKYFSGNHEYVLCYAKNLENVNIFGRKRTEEYNKVYKNLDNDVRGNYLLTPLNAKSGTKAGIYKYKFSNGLEWTPPKGTYPRFSIETLEKLEKDNRIYFPKNNGIPQKKTFLSEVSNYVKLTTFWNYKFAGSTRQSNAEIKNLLNSGGMFDNPKPVKLLKILVESVTMNNDIILDFFAGSGTTAHAVMDLNAEDGGNRKYICVQLDEEVDEKTEAGKAGYKNIAEIARERIRRAGSSIAEAMKDKEKISEDKREELEKRENKLDIGFRSFKVSNSNYRKWEAGDFDMFEEKLLEQAKLFMDKPLIDNYKEINVVFEIMVKEGFALSSKISHKNDVWEIKDNNRKMIIDFGKKINSEKVEKLNLDENDIFVCFDSALNDSDKVNLTKSINLKVV